MATAFAHAFVAVAAGKACFRERRSAKFWFTAVVCSAGPDLDIGLHAYGVAYEDLWGHRGMTHSLFFAAVLSIAIVSFGFRREAPFLSRTWVGYTAFFALLTASHGFIDAFTDGGLGIAFFSPFESCRYFMPWTPLPVPHFGVASLFTGYGLRVLTTEIVLVWLPAGLVAGAVMAVRAARDRARVRRGHPQTPDAPS
jgi:inner membrane protein